MTSNLQCLFGIPCAVPSPYSGLPASLPNKENMCSKVCDIYPCFSSTYLLQMQQNMSGLFMQSCKTIPVPKIEYDMTHNSSNSTPLSQHFHNRTVVHGVKPVMVWRFARDMTCSGAARQIVLKSTSYENRTTYSLFCLDPHISSNYFKNLMW
jgi:hypothetical protein